MFFLLQMLFVCNYWCNTSALLHMSLLEYGLPVPGTRIWTSLICFVKLKMKIGLTETCAGSFASIPNNMEMLGTVGPPAPYVDACLESVPEMGYDALASTPRGEVCIRGNTLFSGYYKREDLTKEAMVDGWFHTGLSIYVYQNHSVTFLCYFLLDHITR